MLNYFNNVFNRFVKRYHEIMLISNEKIIQKLKKNTEFKKMDDFIIIKSLIDYGINIKYEDYNKGFKRGKKNSLVFRLLKKIFSPGGYHSEQALKSILNKFSNHNDNLDILIIGGGIKGKGKSLNKIYESDKYNLISLDIYPTKNVNVICDAHEIPIKNNSFDLIIIQAVLEHVINPEKVVEEIYRLLKSNGFVFAETPFMQTVHEGAFDFTRFTYNGHRYLFRKFKEISSGYIGGVGSTMLWITEYYFRSLFRSVIIGKFFKIILFWLRFTDKLFNEKSNIEGASCFYFSGIKTNSKSISPSQIISKYKRLN